MNENTPMTPAQQLFAEEHHNLVYAFLNEKKLPEDEYYDVVVFGYLQAVMDYTTQGESSRFSFASCFSIQIMIALFTTTQVEGRRKKMNKKQVILTGRLAAPLCEGSRAWIRHHSGLVCTSRVVRIQSLTDRKAVFETMNSMYHVSLETYPFVMELPEAMCA